MLLVQSGYIVSSLDTTFGYVKHYSPLILNFASGENIYIASRGHLGLVLRGMFSAGIDAVPSYV